LPTSSLLTIAARPRDAAAPRIEIVSPPGTSSTARLTVVWPVHTASAGFPVQRKQERMRSADASKDLSED
jgi:hypothetical protein